MYLARIGFSNSINLVGCQLATAVICRPFSPYFHDKIKSVLWHSFLMHQASVQTKIYY